MKVRFIMAIQPAGETFAKVSIVEVDNLLEPPVHTGALASTITIIKVHKLLTYGDYVEVLPEPPVYTGALASSAITIIKVHKLLTSVDFVEILPGTCKRQIML